MASPKTKPSEHQITPDRATATTAQQPEFAIQRLYVKDLSFESPQAPAVFQENLQPNVNLNLQTLPTTLPNDHYEVVLSVTVTATAEERTIFLVEIKQAGMFLIKNVPADQLNPILSVTCPTILFPYAREKISELVASGGFQHFYLAPINFEALYLQNLEKQRGNQSSIITPETATSDTEH